MARPPLCSTNNAAPSIPAGAIRASSTRRRSEAGRASAGGQKDGRQSPWGPFGAWNALHAEKTRFRRVQRACRVCTFRFVPFRVVCLEDSLRCAGLLVWRRVSGVGSLLHPALCVRESLCWKAVVLVYLEVCSSRCYSSFFQTTRGSSAGSRKPNAKTKAQAQAQAEPKPNQS